jgi:hypothetical protein
VTSAGLFNIESPAAVDPALEGQSGVPILDSTQRTTDLIIGERKLRIFLPEIEKLRLRCGQQDDFTTDTEYLIAINRLKDRRLTAVLIRRNKELEACVFFFEYCKFGIGLGSLRGGDHTGQSLVVGPEEFRLQYIHVGVQALLKHWRIFGVSVSVRACSDDCVQLMGPRGKYRMFSGRSIQYTLPLESTYVATLAGMGHRTRRSLAGKRQQLEKSANVVFVPLLEPAQALEAMLMLQTRSLPYRSTRFYQARHRLLCSNPELFCMGMRLPDGTWLSILSGWRRNRITYVDLQLNDVRFKKESLSAVMRCFMLEHEIACKQELINFVGGTSLLLRRYCKPTEACTDIFLGRRCLRAMLFGKLAPRLKEGSFYELVKTGANDRNSENAEQWLTE